MTASPTILFIHGTSSAGKTSIAHAIQEQSAAPWLHLCLDYFYDMQPKKYQTDQWPLYLPLCHGLHRSALVWNDLGMNVIVDTVLEKRELLLDAASVLAQRRAYLIGVTCPVEVAVEREQKRGDRPIGLAKYQHPIVHVDVPYDLMIDSHRMTPDANAEAILSFLAEQKAPSGFRALAARGE